MQTSKIKPGEVYAYRRNSELVRFHVFNIITHRSSSKSTSVAEGYILEDDKEGTPRTELKLSPEVLLGPYAEQAELVERKRQEQAKRDAKQAEALRLGNEDRCALYAFVGLPVPKVKADEYKQPFHVGYNGTLTIRDEGTKLIVAKVRALQEEVRGMEPQTTTTEHSPALLAAAKAQWKAEGKV